MHLDPKLTIDCPYCGAPIYQTVSWFKKAYSTCPACDQGLVAGQFASIVADLEQAMDENIEEVLHGKSQAGCCNKGGTCS